MAIPKNERIARKAEKFLTKPVPSENAEMISRFAISGHFLANPPSLATCGYEGNLRTGRIDH